MLHAILLSLLFINTRLIKGQCTFNADQVSILPNPTKGNITIFSQTSKTYSSSRFNYCEDKWYSWRTYETLSFTPNQTDHYFFHQPAASCVISSIFLGDCDQTIASCHVDSHYCPAIDNILLQANKTYYIFLTTDSTYQTYTFLYGSQSLNSNAPTRSPTVYNTSVDVENELIFLQWEKTVLVSTGVLFELVVVFFLVGTIRTMKSVPKPIFRLSIATLSAVFLVFLFTSAVLWSAAAYVFGSVISMLVIRIIWKFHTNRPSDLVESNKAVRIALFVLGLMLIPNAGVAFLQVFVYEIVDCESDNPHVCYINRAYAQVYIGYGVGAGFSMLFLAALTCTLAELSFREINKLPLPPIVVVTEEEKKNAERRIRILSIFLWVSQIVVFATCWAVYWSIPAYLFCLILLIIAALVFSDLDRKTETVKDKRAVIILFYVFGILTGLCAIVALSQSCIYAVISSQDYYYYYSSVMFTVMGFVSSFFQFLVCLFSVGIAVSLGKVTLPSEIVMNTVHVAKSLERVPVAERVDDRVAVDETGKPAIAIV